MGSVQTDESRHLRKKPASTQPRQNTVKSKIPSVKIKAEEIKTKFEKAPKERLPELPLKDSKAANSNEALDVGRILASARIRSGVTAFELAKKIGLSTSYLSMIERGKRPLRRETLYLIDEQLDIPKDDYKKLWAYSARGMGKALARAVADPKITEDPYKEALMFAFARAISTAEHIEDIFDNHAISKTLTDVSVKKGPSKSAISFSIKVEDDP